MSTNVKSSGEQERPIGADSRERPAFSDIEMAYGVKTNNYLRRIERIRWPINTRCAFCCSIITDKSVDLFKKEWRIYHCPSCEKEFTVLSNTPLEKTKLNPKQLWKLLYLIKHNKLALKQPRRHKHFSGIPSALAKRVGVHHWTMTKIINRVKGQTPDALLNKHGIAGMEDMFYDLFKDERELIIPALILVTYKYVTHDPRGLSAISGCSLEFTAQAIERIKESWELDKEFEEEQNNWYDPESWSSPAGEITLALHCLSIMGEISRDSATKMWSLKTKG